MAQMGISSINLWAVGSNPTHTREGMVAQLVEQKNKTPHREFPGSYFRFPVAQWIGHLASNETIGGSIPSGETKEIVAVAQKRVSSDKVEHSCATSGFKLHNAVNAACKLSSLIPCHVAVRPWRRREILQWEPPLVRACRFESCTPDSSGGGEMVDAGVASLSSTNSRPIYESAFNA